MGARLAFEDANVQTAAPFGWRPSRPVLLFVFGIALLCAPTALLADPGILGIGPEALGKGGAFTAEADDPTAVWWNPAGAVFAKSSRIALSYGLLERPDPSAGDFGNTDQYFLGGLWVAPPEKSYRTKRISRPYGALLAVGKPTPRIEYSASAAVRDTTGTPQTLTASLRRDTMEILAGGSLTLADWEEPDGRMAIAVGVSLGIGLADDSWRGSLTTGPASAGLATDEARETGAFLPFGAGVLGVYVPRKGPRLSAGFSVRMLRPLSAKAPLDFGGAEPDLDAASLSPLFPWREFRLGASALFEESVRISAETQWLYFENPALFPDAFPSRSVGARVGGELGIPLGPKKTSLSVRAGLSWNWTFDDLPDGPMTCDMTGIYAGLGATLFDTLHLDAYACVQVPVGSDVDPHVLGGLSAGLSF